MNEGDLFHFPSCVLFTCSVDILLDLFGLCLLYPLCLLHLSEFVFVLFDVLRDGISRKEHDAFVNVTILLSVA